MHCFDNNSQLQLNVNSYIYLQEDQQGQQHHWVQALLSVPVVQMGQWGQQLQPLPVTHIVKHGVNNEVTAPT